MAANVPLKNVVLTTAGVGYFEHRGVIDGDDEVALPFRTGQINDLLKTLVVDAGDGGQAGLVSYGSRDPVTKTLETFAVDLTGEPTLADLLGQARGQAVEVVTAESTARGTLVGVESRPRLFGERAVDVPYVVLAGEASLSGAFLDDVRSLRFLDEALDAELRRALATLAAGRRGELRDVRIAFHGEGTRDVAVGYVRETPVWKTTYRVVLDGPAGDDGPADDDGTADDGVGTARLQGWAIVENQTEADWEGVTLTLASGRPLAFRMDLDTPLYATRPVVVPELFEGLRPQTYERGLKRETEEAYVDAYLAEPTRDRHRFKLRLPPRSTETFAVVQRGEDVTRFALARGEGKEEEFALFLGSEPGVVADDVRAVIEEVVARRAELDAARRRHRDLEKDRDRAASDQGRLRENLAAVEKTGPLYARYAAKLGESEDRLEQVDAELSDLIDRIAGREEALGEYLDGLTVGA